MKRIRLYDVNIALSDDSVFTFTQIIDILFKKVFSRNKKCDCTTKFLSFSLKIYICLLLSRVQYLCTLCISCDCDTILSKLSHLPIK